ncbi:MAG: Rha family transcriptional regulator [Proteobacteria bacterium]|nr:Rha family transcriptional regulator [Pseudomonadota bacterium]
MNEITLTLKNGRVTTTSDVVARHFGKLHKNVLRAIDSLECSKDFHRLNFEPIDYIDKNCEPQRSYRLTLGAVARRLRTVPRTPGAARWLLL